MKKLTYNITINASAKKVWETMLGENSYREWTLAFNPSGSWYEGSWDKGSKIKFIGVNKETGERGGMSSKIADNRQYEYLSIQHLGTISGDKEDFDSDEVKKWLPSFENYTFEQIGENETKLLIEVDMPDEYAEMMDEMWPKALEKLKSLCE